MCGLVLIVLPLSRRPIVVLAALGLGFLGLAILLGVAGLHELANFAKLGAMTFLAWTVPLAASRSSRGSCSSRCIIPWVDAYSVWRGPTKSIVNHHESVFSAFSFAFPLPDGAHGHLGLPDLLFFSLFLGAAFRFGLRV